jgi:hypothetical protein
MPRAAGGYNRVTEAGWTGAMSGPLAGRPADTPHPTLRRVKLPVAYRSMGATGVSRNARDLRAIRPLTLALVPQP